MVLPWGIALLSGTRHGTQQEPLLRPAGKLVKTSGKPMKKVHLVNPRDNVAVAVTNLAPGETVVVERQRGLHEEMGIRADIPAGHKLALTDLSPGDRIIKYGEVIGRASRKIQLGDHVHVHNLESLRARGDLKNHIPSPRKREKR
jgi:altronate dehydratase small subunit